MKKALLVLLLATTFYLMTGFVRFEGGFDEVLVIKPYPIPAVQFGGGEEGYWQRTHPGEDKPWYMKDHYVVVADVDWEQGEPTWVEAYWIGLLMTLIGWLFWVLIGCGLLVYKMIIKPRITVHGDSR